MEKEQIEGVVRQFLSTSDTEQTVRLKIKIMHQISLSNDMEMPELTVIFHADGEREAHFSLVDKVHRRKPAVQIHVRVKTVPIAD